MSEDSETPELFSEESQPAPVDPGSEAGLFSDQTATHHSQAQNAGNPAPTTVVQSGSASAKSLVSTLSIPTEWSRFLQIEVIKSGSFGVVCRAIDSQSGQVVALKFPRPEKLRDRSDLKMFVDEANRAMELDHPGIVRTYSVEESAGWLAIVQQFIDGSDLSKEKETLTNLIAIATLVARIAEALSYAHRLGIYHRDLKPANILVDKQGNPYITDFGLAMNEREQLYLPRQRCGTPHYMPPEQVAGLTRRLDGRSDIWSLGVILYELLTKRRPFHGNNEQEIYDQIEHNDPRPPRQIDPTIDRELQRICLKCLERQQRDRYPTADDLAEDLHHWIANPAPDRPKVGQKFVSRGLRAFTTEDADFFLELIPGARDRNGLPSSIKFWLNRILLPKDVDLVTPWGVIFGPSGCGKTSFVRAGLIPLLTPDIVTVVVDCSADDTETRLLRLLSERLVDVPNGIGLIDLCAGISQGLWRPKAKSKVLIVLDQLEQRLHGGDDFRNSELVKALRFCDGRLLQTLLLCRDDFLTYLSRFTDSLGLDLREGDNAQSIDLFDRKHARNILLKYGQAFGQLPEQAELSKTQEEFLQTVISQLATADYVVCVRLVLFAEMFRERPWNLAELQVVGGVSGIGEKFLDATFGPEGRDKRLRSQGRIAQKILAALLPPSGLDIRSGSKTEQELFSLAGQDTAPQMFAATLKSLDTQLKLISRVEEASGNSSADGASLPAVVFQLTHDSLIGSIRGWLERLAGRTRAGRASLRLRELGAQVLPGRTPRYLPTHAEWLSWQYWLRHQGRTKSEQVVWDAARRRFLRDFGLGVAALLMVGLISGLWYAQSVRQDREDRISQAINDLLKNEIALIPTTLGQLDANPDLALPRLRSIFDSESSSRPDKIRAALGLVTEDPRARADLMEAAVSPETQPEQLAVIAQRLGPLEATAADSWLSIYADSEQDPRRRFRAFVADVCQGSSKPEWKTHGQAMVGALVAEPISSVTSWLELLQPANTELLPHFQNLFAAAHPTTEPTALALGIVALSSSKVTATEFFLSGMDQWKTPEFQAALSALMAYGCSAELATLAEQRLVDEQRPWPRAALSIALANVGRMDPLVELYDRPANDPAAIFAVHGSIAGRLSPRILRQIYREQGLATFGNDNLRRSVLMAFCLQASSLVDETVQDWLDDVAFQHIVNDPDPGCFSAAELLMRRLGQDPKLAGRPERRAKSDANGILGRVMIDRTGLAFSILSDPSQSNDRIAVCTTELTQQEILDFVSKNPNVMAKFGNPKQAPNGNEAGVKNQGAVPFQHQTHAKDLGLVYEYCNWLSGINELPPESWSYPVTWNLSDVSQVAVDLAQPGFRLLSSTEWQLANRSTESVSKLGSPDGSVVLNYAWLFENSQHRTKVAGDRLPNADGLFDTIGNVEEICHASDRPEQSDEAYFFERGRTIRADVSVFEDKGTGGSIIPSRVSEIHKMHTGFRIMRPLRASDP